MQLSVSNEPHEISCEDLGTQITSLTPMRKVTSGTAAVESPLLLGRRRGSGGNGQRGARPSRVARRPRDSRRRTWAPPDKPTKRMGRRCSENG